MNGLNLMGNMSQAEAQAELVSRGWELDSKAREWVNAKSGYVVSFLNYPSILIFERSYLGHFKGIVTITEMELFTVWINGWYYNTLCDYRNKLDSDSGDNQQ